jgi:hypothetical protein
MTTSYRVVSQRRHINEFFRLRCAADLLAHNLFPNAKEITESMAAYSAVKKYIVHAMGFALDDDSINIVCVGDGSTPRTAALFAFRSKWKCWSIDPNMNTKKQEFIPIVAPPGNDAPFFVHKDIQRVVIAKAKIEEIKLDFAKCIIVCVHSHAKMKDCVGITADKMAIVTMPCCFPLNPIPFFNVQPQIDFQDYGIWSPERTVQIWY